MSITFDKSSHTYTNEQGIKYTSVTELLSQQYPFDSIAIAESVRINPNSKYYGKTVKEILDIWDDTATQGQEVHSTIEDFIKYKKNPDKEKLQHIINKFSIIPFKGKLLSEVLVYHHTYQLAGTIDILEEFDDHYCIWDIKTSKYIDTQKLEVYSMQLELYKILAQYVFKKPCIIGSIIHFENYVKDQENSQMKLLDCIPKLETVTDILIDRYYQLNNW